MSNITFTTAPNDGKEELCAGKYTNKLEGIKLKSFVCARAGAPFTNMVWL